MKDLPLKSQILAAAVVFVFLRDAVAAAAAGGTSDRERAKRQSFSAAIPWLIDCADSVDCIFKITEFATYR